MSKQEAKLLIQDFDPSKDYHFQVTAVRGRERSKALHAKHPGERRREETLLRRAQPLLPWRRTYVTGRLSPLMTF